MESLRTSRVSDVEKAQRLRKAVLKCSNVEVQEPEKSPQAFPFATPSTLSRRDLSILSKQKYWVAEKSDGDRVLLLSLGPGVDEGVYLVDQNFDFFAFERAQLWIPAKRDAGRNQHETLLDAMVVYNHHFKASVVMVLDIYSLESLDMSAANLSLRLQAIREGVIRPIREAPTMKVSVLGKEYWPLENIAKILSSIKEYVDDQGPRFIYHPPSSTRFNENDGVIFVPDAQPLLTGPSTSIKKWKWPRLISVRFLIRPRDEAQSRRYDAYYVGTAGELVLYRELYFVEEDASKIDRALKENDVIEGVFECHYDSDLGEWQANRARFDLDPHPCNIIIGLLEDTSNSISAATLYLKFDEHYKRATSSPGTPQADVPVAKGTSSSRSGASSSQRISPRTATASPGASSGRTPAAPIHLSDKSRRDVEAVMATPSPPLDAVPQGLKRAHPDSLAIEAPPAKRLRTE